MLEINRNYLGDCLEVMKDIENKSVDMVLCDLPYGMTACKWDSVIPFEKLWEQYKRIIKDNGAIVLFGSQPFTSALIMSNPKWFKCEWIWQKNAGSNFGCVKYQPMKEHESVLVFGKGKIKYNPIMQERKGAGSNRVKYKVTAKTRTQVYEKSLHNDIELKISELRYPSSIQKFNRERGLHPTQKPVKLLEYLIKTYTDENELVLDNCIGSGSTCVAAINTNRNFIGIELDKNYCDIANKRIESLK